MNYRTLLTGLVALMFVGCPVTPKPDVREPVVVRERPKPKLPPIPAKLVWSDGSIFVPTREYTTCNISGRVYRIFLPDNRVITKNLYYYEPVVWLKPVHPKNKRPYSEFSLTNYDLTKNAECRKRICLTQGKPKCTVVLSPLPVSMVEIGAANGHPVGKAYARKWRRIFRINQRLQSGVRVIIPRKTAADEKQYCPIPLEIRYRYRAFRGSVAPQLVLDLYSMANSREFQRLSQKVKVGSGNTPTLVAPHQVQSLFTRQSTSLTKYTINFYGDDGSSQPFVNKLHGLLSDGMENILTVNLAADQAKLSRMSKELVSGMDFQKLPDIINKAVKSFNSAKTSREQRTHMSHREKWDFFSVVAKGALEYLGLKDQPAKWTKDEWDKFIHATKNTFKWEQIDRTANTWRIRAINLVRLVVSNQVKTASVRTAKFDLSSFSYQEANYAVNVRCKCIPRDGHCDAGCETFGTSPQDDCGWCRPVCKVVRVGRARDFCHTTPNMHNRSVIRSGTICLPAGHIISKLQYFCHGAACPWSYDPRGGYGANYRLHTGNRCAIWARKWGGRPVRECYRVHYTVPVRQCPRVCTRR
ncbi:hypothetical protein ACFL3C_01945 [Patescibacteria group bacterium]